MKKLSARRSSSSSWQERPLAHRVYWQAVLSWDIYYMA